MNSREQISLLLCRFTDKSLEKAYQEYMLVRNARLDTLALFAGIMVYLSYIAMDLMILENAREAIILRLGGAFICLITMGGVHFGLLGKRLDRIIPLLIVGMGMVLNMIIKIEPTIENNYYIGLIQIGVFISFMLRAGFVPTNIAMATLFAGYLWAVADKGLFGSLMLNSQLYFLSMTFATCACGIYLLERYRRRLFLNSTIIDEQNTKLEALVEDLEQTVSRKTAMLKVFAHVMKTPVHQIVGFLQVIRNEMTDVQPKSCSVDYAEQAAAALRHNVEEMVDYHFVDNAILTDELDQVNLHNNLEELFYRQIDSGVMSISGKRPTLRLRQEIFWLGMKYLERYYRERAPGHISVEIVETKEAYALEFTDDLQKFEPEEFRRKTCQLTEIHNYLSGEGANPEMPLRIVARAFQQAGVEFKLLEKGQGGFRIIIAAIPAANAA